MATNINNGESGASVRSKINEAIDELNAAQTDIDALETTVSSHTSSISSLNSSVSSLSTTVSGHTTSISQLNTALITQAGQISTLSSSVSTLSSTVAGHTTDISSLNSSKQNKDRDSTLTVYISEESSDFSNPVDYISTLFLFEGTGGVGNVLTLTDSSTSGAPLGKPFFVYNTNASIDSLVITPDGGVTCEYAGSLTSTIAPGDYAKLIQVALNTWVRVQ